MSEVTTTCAIFSCAENLNVIAKSSTRHGYLFHGAASKHPWKGQLQSYLNYPDLGYPYSDLETYDTTKILCSTYQN